jgi:5-carboxymethyl-2-hydroxymuconate isomerase
MPQITLEYSANILEKNPMTSVLKNIHEMLATMLPTDINTCKSRAFSCDTFLVGDGRDDRAFIHCTIKILAGRTLDIKKEIANKVLEYLKTVFVTSLQKLRLQITVELSELPEIYIKAASE